MARCVANNTCLDDARVDWSAGRVPPKVLTCDARMEWFDIFRQHVAKGEVVDLVKFNQDYDANICERIAARHGMTFSTDPEHDTAFLRKKQQN